MIRTIKIVSLLMVFAVLSCGEESIPKPKSYLILKYPENSYTKLESFCNYQFEFSKWAVIKEQENCWATIDYPTLKAKIHITYRKVDNNLFEILREVEKLTYEHTVKADAMSTPKTWENRFKKVYAQVNKIEGNVASNVQFSATDSLNHVLAGALYFYAKPNYDSIIPAIKYIEKDIIHLVETLEWK